MAIYVGDKIVKNVYIGDVEIGNGANVHVGGEGVHQYTFTVTITNSVTNGTLSGNSTYTYTGYVGETFTDSVTASPNSGFLLSAVTASDDSASIATSASGVEASWTVTIPQDGGSGTVTVSGTAVSASNSITANLGTAPANTRFENFSGSAITSVSYSGSSGSTGVRYYYIAPSPDYEYANASGISASASPSTYVAIGSATLQSDGRIRVATTLTAPPSSTTATITTTGAPTAKSYTYTISFTDNTGTGISIGTSNHVVTGSVGTSLGGTRSVTLGTNYSLTSLGAASSNSTVSASGQQSNNRITWSGTMPSGGGSATITVTGTAVQPTWAFTDWTGGLTGTVAATGGTPSVIVGNAAAASPDSVPSKAFLSSCSATTETVNVDVTVPANYANSGQIVSGNKTVSQAAFPAYNPGNPSTFSIGASGGTPSLQSGYTATSSVSSRSFNDGCSSKSVSVGWSSTVSSGNYCTNSATGTVSGSQSSYPALNVSNPSTFSIGASGGTPTLSSGYTATSSVSSRTFNDGCSNKSVSVGWKYTVSSGNYCNNSDTGTVSGTQSAFPAVSVSDPTGSVSQGGTVSFNESGYTHVGSVSANTGCARDVTVSWDYEVSSGNYCNNSDIGNVTLTQAKLAGSVTLTASNTSFPSSGGTQTVATISASGCDTGYGVTSTPSLISSCTISGTNLTCTAGANTGSAKDGNVVVSRDGDSDSVEVSIAAGTSLTLNSIPTQASSSGTTCISWTAVGNTSNVRVTTSPSWLTGWTATGYAYNAIVACGTRAANTSSSSRSGTLTITQGSLTSSQTVTQNGKVDATVGFLPTPPLTLTASPAQSKTTAVSGISPSNGGWNLSTSGASVLVIPNTGVGDNGSITVSTWSFSSPGTGTITLKGGEVFNAGSTLDTQSYTVT